MSLKHGLLGLLNYGSMTGYELDKAFKSSLAFFWHAKSSQIYRELDAMERKGWLVSKRVIQEDKPNKRVYSITTAGKSELDDWLASPEKDIDKDMEEKSPFLMRMFFAGETSREHALKMLRTFGGRCQEFGLGLSGAHESIARFGSSLDEGKTEYWKITLLYGEMIYKTMSEWTEKAIAILEEKQ